MDHTVIINLRDHTSAGTDAFEMDPTFATWLGLNIGQPDPEARVVSVNVEDPR